jgi:predicted dehydrogenase
MKDEIGFGVLGVAHHHSRTFGAAATRIPGARLVGVYDPDEERCRAFASRLGIGSFSSLEDFLNEDNLDVCIVTCENSKKKEFAIMAAEARKHVLCDKPLGVNSIESEQMIRSCKEARVKLQVGYLSRYTPQALRAKEMIEKGKVGKVCFVMSENRVDVGHVKQLSPWLANREAAGGGAILEHAVHAADLSMWYAASTPVCTYALCAPNLDSSFEVEDNFTLSVKFANGAIATIDGSYCRATSGNPGDISMKIVGSKNELTLSIANQSIMEYVGEEPRAELKQFVTRLNDSYEGLAVWNMVNDMVKCIRTGSEPLSCGTDAKRVNQIVEAAYQSLAARSVVMIDDVRNNFDRRN